DRKHCAPTHFFVVIQCIDIVAKLLSYKESLFYTFVGIVCLMGYNHSNKTINFTFFSKKGVVQ
ncbi:hypothetical protein, partial [Prevotella sp. B2-R-102]|uniref:hypothetical protein n=1 Tax=Segatella intestinalis TaxID=3035284 RepID=UPI0023EACC14